MSCDIIKFSRINKYNVTIASLYNALYNCTNIDDLTVMARKISIAQQNIIQERSSKLKLLNKQRDIAYQRVQKTKQQWEIAKKELDFIDRKIQAETRKTQVKLHKQINSLSTSYSTLSVGLNRIH